MKNLLLNILPFNSREDMPKIQYIIKKFLAFLLCFFGAGIICEGIVIGAMTAAGKDPLHGDMFSPFVMEMIMYYGYAAIIGLIFLYWKAVEKKPLSELGFTRDIGGYLVGWGWAAFLLGVSIVLIAVTGAVKLNGVFPKVNITAIALYFGAFIFQGMYEEVLVRGILLQTLRRRLSLPVSIVLSSVPFILLHLSSMKDGGVYTLLGIANLAAISFVFSMLTVKTGSIWAACGLHSLWNFALQNILGLNLSGNEASTAAVFDMTTSSNSILNGGNYGIEASVMTLTVLIAAGIVMCFMKKKNSGAIA